MNNFNLDISGLQLEELGSGIRVNRGISKGKIVFSSDDIVNLAPNEAYIVVGKYTNSEDIPMLAKANGLLTAIGGRLSHAATIATHMGIPAIVGAGFTIEPDGIILNGIKLNKFDEIILNANCGTINRIIDRK